MYFPINTSAVPLYKRKTVTTVEHDFVLFLDLVGLYHSVGKNKKDQHAESKSLQVGQEKTGKTIPSMSIAVAWHLGFFEAADLAIMVSISTVLFLTKASKVFFTTSAMKPKKLLILKDIVSPSILLDWGA